VVTLSNLTKSSGKIAEFYFERIWREKHVKTVNLSANWALVLSGTSNLYIKTEIAKK
jgi:hypothetical protein